MHPRPSSNPKPPPRTSLRLPSMPRSHSPPRASSSNHSTPDGAAAASSPPAAISPRAHPRMHSDAQKQLYLHQRELLAAILKGSSAAGKPTSPRLAPLGSPGPVTPLELERQEGYLVAGARSACASTDVPTDEMVEQLVRAELQRQQHAAARTTTAAAAEHAR